MMMIVVVVVIVPSNYLIYIIVMMMMMMMMIIQFQVDIKEVMWKHNSPVIVQGLYTFAVYN